MLAMLKDPDAVRAAEAWAGRPRGRPPAIDTAAWYRILGAILLGATLELAAWHCAGVTRSAVYKYMDRFPRRRQEYEEHCAIAIGMVERSLFVNATQEMNPTAQIFYLCNRAKDRWKNVKHIQGGIEGLDQVVQLIQQAAESDEDLPANVERFPGG